MSPHAEGFSSNQGYGDHGAESAGNTQLNEIPPSPPVFRSNLARASDNDVLDLVCVGFGPASLATAIALHDSLESKTTESGPFTGTSRPPKVLFLEQQTHFAWHEGMLLPGAKMQITFLKDLATMRNPRSHFTFVNYLYEKNRLVHFSNLDTFLPQRIEFEDYMRWCADSFSDVVEYGRRVTKISRPDASTAALSTFKIEMKNVLTDEMETVTAKNIVIAIGGRPNISPPFQPGHKRIIHSSQYIKTIDQVLTSRTKAYNLTVVGAGQSAAEVFNDLHSRFPNATTTLIIKGDALRPSDDSPFVNEIFDPNRVDDFFSKSEDQRRLAIEQDRGTNYGVVRPALLENIYHMLYAQRIKNPSSASWQHRILNHSMVTEAEADADGVDLCIRSTIEPDSKETTSRSDAVIIASGYSRDAHHSILSSLNDIALHNDAKHTEWAVGRDYRVQFKPGHVDPSAGIWLQGCNESTHGLSDTLLSILATRGGELVESIFSDHRERK